MTLNMRRRQDGHENFRDDKVSYRRLRATASSDSFYSLFLILLWAKKNMSFFSFFHIQTNTCIRPESGTRRDDSLLRGWIYRILHDYCNTLGLF